MSSIAQPSRSGLLRNIGQVLLVILLIPVGLTLGALTGVVVLSPIMGMVVPLAAATWFLRREGQDWRSLGFARAMPGRRFLTATALITLLAVGLALSARWVLQSAGFPAPDTSALRSLIEGNTLYYLLFLLPVAWGSAAFGEELLMRGFVLNRLERMGGGTTLAVVLQAAIFAVAHAYQGLTGVLAVFVIALVMGFGYLRSGRNLWPVIVAHGLIDTVAITALYLGAGWV